MKSVQRKKLYIVLAFLLLCAGAFLMRPDIRFSEKKPVLERGYEYKAKDFVARTNGEVACDEEMLYTEEVGEFTHTYHVKKWIFSRDVSFSYEVKDTIPPVITFKEETVVIDSGEEYGEEQIRANIAVNEGTYAYDTDFDDSFPGIYLVNVMAEDDYGNSSEKSYNIVIRDNEAPMILAAGYGASIVKGNSFNIQNYIAYGDNADPSVKLTVDGEVNTNKVGTYPLHITLSDDAGNLTEWDIDVKVIAKAPKPSKDDDEEEWFYAFEDFRKDYSGGKKLFGIDVSSWQGEVDYEAVRQAGCDFVIMRIGFSDRGRFKLDNEYERNIVEAKKAGLKVGVYFFSYDANEEELLKSLSEVFAKLEGVELDLPIAFDWEDFMDFQTYEMSFKSLNHLYDVFVEECEKRGYEAMLYGSKYYLDTIWSKTDRKKIWLAQYTDEPSFDGKFEVWQLSESGQIPGIEGHVDLDILYLEEE